MCLFPHALVLHATNSYEILSPPAVRHLHDGARLRNRDEQVQRVFDNDPLLVRVIRLAKGPAIGIAEQQAAWRPDALGLLPVQVNDDR